MFVTYCYDYTGIASLRVLHVGWNHIGDDGVLVMMDGLQHNKTLTKLDVTNCGLSAKGTI